MAILKRIPYEIADEPSHLPYLLIESPNLNRVVELSYKATDNLAQMRILDSLIRSQVDDNSQTGIPRLHIKGIITPVLLDDLAKNQLC